MTRLSRASKYGENSIEIASPCLKTRFIIKAESEPIADMFVRSFQKAKVHANSLNFSLLNELLKKNAAFEHTEERMKELTKPGKFFKELGTIKTYSKKYFLKFG